MWNPGPANLSIFYSPFLLFFFGTVKADDFTITDT